MSGVRIVLPGDDITDLINKNSLTSSTSKDKQQPKKIIVGPGLTREDNSRIVAVKCGQLFNRNNAIYWVDSHVRRYIASRADKVIGFVVSKQAFNAKVDIGTNECANLSLLAFPNATKRNKGMIEVGDAVYAQVVTDCKDVETELTCVTSDNKKGGLGLLANTGYVLTIPINIARRLLSPDSKLLANLGKKYRYELTVAMNGRVWVNSTNLDTTLTIVNFIASLEHIPMDQYQQMCDQLTQEFQQIGRK